MQVFEANSASCNGQLCGQRSIQRLRIAGNGSIYKQRMQDWGPYLWRMPGFEEGCATCQLRVSESWQSVGRDYTSLVNGIVEFLPSSLPGVVFPMEAIETLYRGIRITVRNVSGNYHRPRNPWSWMSRQQYGDLLHWQKFTNIRTIIMRDILSVSRNSVKQLKTAGFSTHHWKLSFGSSFFPNRLTGLTGLPTIILVSFTNGSARPRTCDMIKIPNTFRTAGCWERK